MKKRTFAAIAAGASMFVLVGTAAAQTPSSVQYDGGVLGEGPGGTQGGGAGGAGTTSAGSGSLPFTGFQAGLLALGGAGMIGTGIALRRRGSQPI